MCSIIILILIWKIYIGDSIKVIISDSGIEEINKHFKKVSKSNPSTPVIERIKELEKFKRKNKAYL